MRVERISSDPCGLARRWLLDPQLATDLVRLDRWASERISTARVGWPGLFIISGHRTTPLVPALSPDAPAATQSLHLLCPSLAADLRVGNAPASFTPLELWTALGLQWERQGGRWGGRFEPSDPNHFDIGQGFDPSRTTLDVQPPMVTGICPVGADRLATWLADRRPVCLPRRNAAGFQQLTPFPCKFNPMDPDNC